MNSIKLSLLILATSMFIISCSKSDFVKDELQKELDGKIELRDGELMDRAGCFELIYPVSVMMANNETVTGNSRTELGLAIRTWYASHPDADKKHVLIYPVSAQFGDKTISIENEEQMARIRKYCTDKNDVNVVSDNCIELLYPISYTMPDGTVITGNDALSIRLKLKEWYEAHPDSKEKPALEYPVNILFKGEAKTIESHEAMVEVKKLCAGDKEENRCFDFIYPINYTMPDGTVITGNDALEIKTAMKVWYEAHPDSQEKPSLTFPVDVTFLKDGSVKTINDAGELKKVYEWCK